MKNYPLKQNTGFTLVETIVVIFIFGLLITGTSLMLKNILVNSRQQIVSINNLDLTRRVANNFVNEVRNASYGVNGSYPINQASDTQIIFFSTAPNNSGTVARVRYYITGTTLYRGITNPSGSTYNTATEKSTIVMTNLSLGANPLFYYYDGTSSQIAQPANINSIKLVKINLVVQKQSSVGLTSTFTVNASAAIRNLKTNLGN
ncbi:MAG: prepilin-type N-terminal cleavage/methylation domain-containing protein [bacterium]